MSTAGQDMGPEPARAISTLRAAFKRRPGTVAIAVSLALAAAAVSLLTPLIVRGIIIDVSGKRMPVLPAVLLTALTLGGGFAAAWSTYQLGRVGEYGVASVRRRIIRHVLRMGIYDVRSSGPGDLVSRATVDSAQLRSITDVSVTALPVSVVIIVFSLVLMGLLDWILLIIVVVTFTCAGIAIRAFLHGVRRGTSEKQAALGALGDRFSVALGALAMVKAYRAEEMVTEPVDRQIQAAADAAVAADRSQAFVTPLMGLGQQIAIIGVLASSGVLLTSGRLSAANFVAFLMYLFQLISPLTLVASAFSRIQSGLAAVERIDSVLAGPVENPGPPTDPAFTSAAVALEFCHVNAGYEGTQVLSDVSISIPARGLTALIGESGVGKSTVLGLAERFLLPDSGSIRLHGHDLADWPLTSLRTRLAYVDQSITLLDGTIRENLTVGASVLPSDDTLFAALREVDLADVIARLPSALDTRVGGASDLSGGQRQRLSIARALLRQADVFLLDEPSSQLDGINEQRLIRVMEKLAQRSAVVVVAHRLSTVRSARHIVFLERGRVIGQGSHNVLVETCPSYCAFIRAQSPGRPDNVVESISEGA